MMTRMLLFGVTVLFIQDALCDPGTSFLVTFPQSLSGNLTGAIFFTSAGNYTANVNMSSLPAAPIVIDEKFVVTPYSVSSFDIKDMRLMLPAGSFISNMSLKITSSADIVVVVFSVVMSNGDIYSPVPISKLGMEYFAMAYKHTMPIGASFITVTSAYDETEVKLTLPTSIHTSEIVVIGDVTYSYDDVINVKLKEHETLQIQTVMDLTGTHIISNKPILVLSGVNRTRILGHLCASHLLDEMPPTENFGKRFVLISTPEQQTGDLYRFLAKEPLTTVKLATGEVIKLQYPGSFGEYILKPGKFVYATADKPILVAQYSLDQEAVEDISGIKYRPIGDPSLSILSPLEHALSEYHFALTTDSDKHTYVTLTTNATQIEHVRMNGVNISARNVQWSPVNGSADYVAGQVRLENGDFPCTLGETEGPGFLAHVHIVETCECYSMPLTLGRALYPNTENDCPTRSHEPGDKIDNDCDGRIDEEACCINTAPGDDDGDFYKDEDCSGSVGSLTCCDNQGNPYTCQEIWTSTLFTEVPNSRKRSSRAMKTFVDTKLQCGIACARSLGCWGMNYDHLGRDGHNCELLFGEKQGLIKEYGWGFQSFIKAIIYSM